MDPRLPIPTEELGKRRCRFSLPGTRRHWVPVMDDGNKADVVIEGTVLESRMSLADLPLNHSSFDWNLMLEPDPAYRPMLAEQPRQVPRDPERPDLGNVDVMEIEWETNHLPLGFRPVRGDRAWIMGRWIFDCGHKPFKTEIHPPKALAFSRLEPVIVGDDSLPAWTRVARVFVTGKWGGAGNQKLPIGGQSYRFALDFPAQPSKAAEPSFELRDVNFGGPTPVLQVEDTPGQGKRLSVSFELGPEVQPDSRHSFAVVLGWREPVLSVGYRRLRVDLQSLTVLKTHDLLDFPPKWNLIVRVNGRWLPLIGRTSPGEESRTVRAGEQIPLSQGVELLVRMDEEVQVETLGWVSRPGEKLFDVLFDEATEAPPLEVQEEFLTRAIGLDRLTDWVEAGDVGRISERLTWPEGTVVGEDRVALSEQNGHKNTDGDFELAYRIEEIQRFDAGARQDLG